MRKVLLFGLILLLLTGVTTGNISLGVDTERQPELLLINESLPSDQPKHWTVEVRNTGSTPVAGRLHLAVVRNTTLFEAWSDPLQLQAGDAAARTLTFPRPDVNGTLQSRISFHYGTMRTQLVTSTFQSQQWNTSPRFSVPVIRTWNDHVRLGIDAPTDVDTMIVTVQDASTRGFAQVRVEDPGAVAYVDVPYHPAVRNRAAARIVVSDGRGAYYHTERVMLTPQNGVAGLFLKLFDRWVDAPLFHMVLI